MRTGGRRRQATVAAGSVVLHALAIFLLVQGLEAPPPPRLAPGVEESVVPVIMTPRRARPPPAATSHVRPRPTRSQRVETSVAPLLVTPAPVSAPTVAPPAPSSLAPDMRRALRANAFGCSQADLVGLTLRERERCHEKLGARYRQAPDLPVGLELSAEKRKTLDAAAAAKARRRAYKEAPMPAGTALSDPPGYEGEAYTGRPGPREATRGLGEPPRTDDRPKLEGLLR